VCEDVVSVKGGSSSVVTEFGLFLFVPHNYYSLLKTYNPIKYFSLNRFLF